MPSPNVDKQNFNTTQEEGPAIEEID
jgi:hypothetical protein